MSCRVPLAWPRARTSGLSFEVILGGSWVAISRVTSRITMVITYIRGLKTPLITAHEPPSTVIRKDGSLV